MRTGRDAHQGMSLNRTFYGIETGFRALGHLACLRLNRTFYGIETKQMTAEEQNSPLS